MSLKRGEEMNREDIDDLFKLLQLYFPNSDKTRNETLKTAWLLLLEPYDRDTVRNALTEQLRESKFFPDPQSIASRCPPVLRKKGPGSLEPVPDSSGWEKQAELLKRYGELIDRRRAAGIPGTWSDAQEAGMDAETWDRLTDHAGLGVEVIL